MPFDALPTLDSTDALVALGIVPVPPALVADYRQEVMHRYGLRSAYHRSLVDRKFVKWRTIALQRTSLVQQLLNPSTRKHTTDDFSGAPKPLIALAVHVRKNVREASFSMEYFDTDPILNVLYDGKIATLGVWDHGKIVHIAEWTRPLSRMQRIKQTLSAIFG